MKLTLNLASRRYVNQRALKRSYLLLGLLLLVVLGIQFSHLLKTERELAAVQQNLRNLQQQMGGNAPAQLPADQLKKQLALHQLAGELLARDAFRWTGLFDLLERTLPVGVSLRSLSPDYKQKSLVLNGVAKDLKSLQRLLDNLHAEKFEQVFLENQSRIEINDGRGGKLPVLSFNIKLTGVF